MSWIFPPEGCDGTPINTALVRHYWTADHCPHSRTDERVIYFAFTEDDWSNWTFKTKEARDTALNEINATLADDPLKGIARELDFISRSAVLS